MPALVFVNSFTTELAEGSHDFDNDVFKLMLMNTAPSVTNTVPSNWTEIAAGNGYVAGGVALTLTPSTVGNVTTIGAANTSITASGGNIGPFQWAGVYNSTKSLCVGTYNYGVAGTIVPGNPLNLTFTTSALVTFTPV